MQPSSMAGHAYRVQEIYLHVDAMTWSGVLLARLRPAAGREDTGEGVMRGE